MNTRRNAIRVSTLYPRRAAAAVGLCLALLAGALAQQNSSPPRLSPKKAAEILQFCVQLAGVAGDDIWPGFDARKYAFVNLAADATGYSLGFSDAPQDPQRRTLLMTYDIRNYGLEEAVSLAFHESFHVFESDGERAGAKWRRENSMLVAAYPETEVRLSALFNIEGQLLLAALRAKDEAARRDAARRFLAVRRLRHGEMEGRFVEFEKGAESNEGLAEYAGTKAVLLGITAARQQRLSIPFQHEDERSYLEKKYAQLASITDAGKNSRLRFYFTGSAQGLLLDRLMPDWRRRVQFDAVALQDLLTEAVSPAPAGAADGAAATLKEYDYAGVVKREEANVAQKQAQKQAVLDGVLRQKGRRYVLDFSQAGKMGNTNFFDPMNITMVTRQTRVHTRMLKIGEDGVYAGEFEQAVVEDFERRQYLTIVEAGEQEITADGVRLDITKPAQTAFKTRLLIKTPKFTFTATSGTVTITDAAVIVKLH